MPEFKDALYNFSEDVEIYKLRSTSKNHIIQIIAKDEILNVVIILTWDFKHNKEVSML